MWMSILAKKNENTPKRAKKKTYSGFFKENAWYPVWTCRTRKISD